MAQITDIKLNDLCDFREIVQHQDVSCIVQAVVQECSFMKIQKLIEKLKATADGAIFDRVIYGLAFTMVRCNRKDLICLVLDKYLPNVNRLSGLFLFASACQHHQITKVLLGAGADPLESVSKVAMFASAPHEDLSKTMLGLEDMRYKFHPCHFIPTWEVTLMRDDLVLFNQIYEHFTKTLKGYRTYQRATRFNKVLTLEDVCHYKAYNILDYCLANQTHRLSKRQRALWLELWILFDNSYQHTDILQLLYRYNLLQADMECRFVFKSESISESCMPPNQLHHVVSSGALRFLSRGQKYDESDIVRPNGYLGPQLPEVICFLLGKGVQAEGLALYCRSYSDHSLIRPVTSVAFHISSWVFPKHITQSHPCSIEEYITWIHNVMDTLPPFFPRDMRSSEVNPICFTIEQINDLFIYMEHRWPGPNYCPKHRFLESFKEALMITEDLCLYFWKQGFKLSPKHNIYNVMTKVLGSLQSFCDWWPQIGPELPHQNARKGIHEILLGFFLRIMRISLGYHDSTARYEPYYRMLCHPYMVKTDTEYYLLKTLLHYSSHREYYQLLQGFTEFMTAETNTGALKDLLELCESLLSNPRTLKHLCRATIFNIIKAPVMQNAQELPLPKYLILYISELS